METWKFQPSGNGRMITLLHGDREVLRIDQSRVCITQDVGHVNQRINEIVGEGTWPTWEDQQLIVSLLNQAETSPCRRCSGCRDSEHHLSRGPEGTAIMWDCGG